MARFKVALLGVCAASFFASGALAQDEKVGAWTVRSITDPITDKARLVAGTFTPDGFLAIKCDAPGPGSVYISFDPHKFLGESTRRGDRRSVTVRFDSDEPSETTDWAYGNTYAILQRGAADRFAYRMMQAKRVVVRASSFEFEEVTGVFDVTGADSVVPRIYASCDAAPPAAP